MFARLMVDSFYQYYINFPVDDFENLLHNRWTSFRGVKIGLIPKFVAR